MKRILSTVLLVTLTILANFQAPMVQAVGTSGPNMPDLTDWTELGQGLTHRVNRTDLVPSNFRHNYTGGTPQLLQFRNMVMEQLTWAYWNGENWEPVDSTLTDDNVLEADIDHFSTWAIIQVEETTEPDTSTGIPIPTAFIAIGIAVALMLRKDSLGISH
jgi:hypothetical protein